MVYDTEYGQKSIRLGVGTMAMVASAGITPRKKSLWKRIVEQKVLVLMILPFLVWIVIFRLAPLFGWIMAFQDFKPGNGAGRGIIGSPFVGLKHFITLFADPMFYLAMRNTLAMSVLGLVFGFTVPILFAVLLNEVNNRYFKKLVQTVSYLPHFISWVIASSIIKLVLSNTGILNDILLNLGMIIKPISFMQIPKAFWWIVVLADLWKEVGWGSIIYLAAITGIDPALYEAAEIDGAGRIRRIWHITLPSIRPTMVVILIISIGWLIQIGFERQYLLGNALVQDYALVLDLYVLNYGLNLARYSFGTAIGIFKSLISLLLVFGANWVSHKFNEGI